MRGLLLVLLSTFTGFYCHSQTFNGIGGPIADESTPTLFFVEVGGLEHDTLNSDYGFATICVDITHPWVSDVNARLISPDGTTVPIINLIGNAGDDFTATCLCDTFWIPLGSVDPPFTGNFKPIGFMGDFNNGQNGVGIWTLSISDNYPGADEGFLNSWSIEFGYNVTFSDRHRFHQPTHCENQHLGAGNTRRT